MYSGGIRERAKGHWEIRIDLGRDADGRRIRRWASFCGTKKEAIAEKNRLIQVLSTGVDLNAERMSLTLFLDKWLESHVSSRVSAKTLHRYEEICRVHLKPHLGHVVLAKLQPLQIQAAYSEMRRVGKRGGGELSARTVLHHHRVLRQALQQAVRWRMIPSNPADLVQAPRPTRKLVHVLTQEQATELLELLRPSWLYLPASIALHTGMRRGEILALKWSDVDFECGQLRVSASLEQVGKSVTFKGTKTGKARVVAMSLALVRVLRTHKARQAAERLRLGAIYEDNDLVCPAETGAPLVPHILSDAFRAAVAKTPLPRVTFHGLRHTHATILLRAGIHPKVVSERLGHSTIGITLDVYSHVLPGMQEGAAKAIDIALGRG